MISFDTAIELKDVYYQYPNAKKSVLNGVSLTILNSILLDSLARQEQVKLLS